MLSRALGNTIGFNAGLRADPAGNVPKDRELWGAVVGPARAYRGLTRLKWGPTLIDALNTRRSCARTRALALTRLFTMEGLTTLK